MLPVAVLPLGRHIGGTQEQGAGSQTTRPKQPQRLLHSANYVHLVVRQILLIELQFPVWVTLPQGQISAKSSHT